MQEPYGAAMERGTILSLADGCARVESLSREGVRTPPLPFLSDFPAAPGDPVYFFLFDDGKGMILGKIGPEV